MKRIFIFILAMVMVLGMFPTTPLHAHATEAEEPYAEEPKMGELFYKETCATTVGVEAIEWAPQKLTVDVMVTTIPTVFRQKDDKWASYPYGKDDEGKDTNLGRAGCGILAYVNAIYYLNGIFIQPTVLADYSLKNGYRINGVGTSADIYAAFAKDHGSEYGFSYSGDTSSYEVLSSNLQAGKVAICSIPGHLMACVDYDSSNCKFLILDSEPSDNRGTKNTGYAWKTEAEMKSLGFRNAFYILEATERRIFDFWAGEDGETISGKHTFWWKQDGFGTCDVNLDLNGKALGTIYPDENGLFSYTLDTTKYENGTYTLSAIIRDLNGWEKTVTRTIHIDNGSFGFWAGEDGQTISATHTFWWKQTKYENCEVGLALNGNALGTIYPDASGLFSYALDTTKYENGTYTISATIRSTNKPEKTVSRTVYIDNGEATFGFWSGEEGETISAKHKFWWKQNGFESSEVDLEINGEALVTRYPDENGLISYTLDTTQYENGAYTISATIRSANKPEKTVSRTVHIDNGDMFFGFWAGEDGETISGTYKFWWKQVGYGACNITIDMNGTVLATKTPDENGLFSYALDTTQYENGTYTIGAKILGAGGSEKYVTRTIQIYNMVPDEEITGLKGDVNLDGVVDMDDVVALMRHVLVAEVITDATALANGEVTNDASLNMDDVVKLMQYVLKAIDSLD